MKLHFLVLSLALVQLAVSQNNQNTDDGIWNNLTPATVDGSTTIQNALSWGVGQVVASAVQAGSIPDTSYDVSGIYYVSQQQQVPQTNYRFEVQVVGAGGQTWRVKCDVNVANGQNTLLRSRSGPESDTRWDQTLQFGAFTFKPTNVYVPATATPPVTTTPPATTTNDTTTTPPATTNTTSSLDSEVWAEVDPNEVDTNEEIQKALIHGVSSVIDLAIENNEFPDTDYDVTGIYSVKKQQQTPSTNYRFEVELMAGTGQPFRVKCDVNVDTTTGVMDTYRWLYGGVDAAVWDQEMTLGTYDFLPDEVYLMDEDYVDAEEDGVVDLGDGLSLLL